LVQVGTVAQEVTQQVQIMERLVAQVHSPMERSVLLLSVEVAVMVVILQRVKVQMDTQVAAVLMQIHQLKLQLQV
jgi:hypothetical protein